MTPKNLAQAIPAKARQWVYGLLGTLIPLEVIFDVIPAGVETKLVAVLAVLGFGTAWSNVQKP